MKKLWIKYKWKIVALTASLLLALLLIFNILYGRKEEMLGIQSVIDWAFKSKMKSIDQMRKEVQRKDKLSTGRLEDISSQVGEAKSRRKERDEQISTSDIKELDKIFENLLQEG